MVKMMAEDQVEATQVQAEERPFTIISVDMGVIRVEMAIRHSSITNLLFPMQPNQNLGQVLGTHHDRQAHELLRRGT